MSRYDAWKAGEIGDDGSHPNSPNFNPPPSVLDCPNETGTWLAENMADDVQTNALEIIGDFITSSMDGYAEAKAHRKLMELAARCRAAIEESESKPGDDA